MPDSNTSFPVTNTSLACANATMDLFGPNDECSRIVEGFVNGNANGSMISAVFNGDCLLRLHNFVTICNISMNNDMVSTLQLRTWVVLCASR